jgi:RecA-family ATPase
MCVAFAEGTKWLSWQCTQGRVLYINLELDRPSCVQRFIDIYSALGMPPRHLTNIRIWHLRGNAVPLDKLAPRIIRRSRNEDFIAVVIDPIYKVLTGDENSAQEMSKFCSYLDRIAAELHCAVIYCHHHSKGAQGQKSSTDRASGSGVFVRDPDAIMDWIELPMDDKNYEALENTRICIDMMDLITKTNPAYLSRIPDDETASEAKMQGHARAALREVYTQDVADNTVDAAARNARAKARRMTGWRTEMTLREFPKPDQTDIFFDYPIHHPDTQGRLKYLEPEGKIPSKWEKPPAKSEEQKLEAKIQKDKEKSNAYLTRLQMEYENLNTGSGIVTLQDLANAVGSSNKSPKFRGSIELLETMGFTTEKVKFDDGKTRVVIRRSN